MTVFRFGVSIGIHFQKKTACYILVYGNTVLPWFHLICQLIATFIFTIDDNVHRLAIRCVWHLHILTYTEGQHIAYQSLVTIVVDETPFLVLGRAISQRTLFIIKLYAIRLLWKKE